MPRLVALMGLLPLLACSHPPACAEELIEFSYLVADTSDTLQPGNKAAAQFTIVGNPNMLLATLTVMAYSGAADTVNLSIYEAQGTAAPDAGTTVISATAPSPAPPPQAPNPNAIPALTFFLATSPNVILQNGTPYWAVISGTQQALTVGIATHGAYAGAYETYGSNGWVPSAASTERMALAMQSPPCVD